MVWYWQEVLDTFHTLRARLPSPDHSDLAHRIPLRSVTRAGQRYAAEARTNAGGAYE